jgi:all-trans-retinol 13,14-reductase
MATDSISDAPDTPATDDSYRRQRARGALDGRFDAIVVGSGAGGLTSAAMLAAEGWRVLVLERHAVAGGCTQVFRRNGFEWDAGLHYMGEVHRESSGLARLFARVTGGRLRWAPMPEIYNRIVIGDESFDYVAGAERFKDCMKGRFPNEGRAIDRYVELVEAANRAAKGVFMSRMLPQADAEAAGAADTAAFRAFAGRTVLDVLRELTSDETLVAVLCGHYGDYSALPDEASFLVHAMVIKHYIDGASYPVGGASQLAETMAATVRAAGGQVLVAADVVRVVVRDGRAVGVEMADGAVLESPVVISGIGIAQTLALLDDGDAEGVADLRARAAALPPSRCYVMLNIGLDRDNETLAMHPANVWAHPTPDLVGNFRRYAAEPSRTELPLHFISQPSAKDPSWPERYPGRATIDICSLTDWSVFAPFADTGWMRRGAEYEDLKARLTEQMLAQVLRFYPQVRGCVAHAELATPLSFNHFLNRRHGDFMSYAQTPTRFAQGWMRAHSPVRGLFFGAQDVAGAGVSGAMVGGTIAASAAIGRDLFRTLRS